MGIREMVDIFMFSEVKCPEKMVPVIICLLLCFVFALFTFFESGAIWETGYGKNFGEIINSELTENDILLGPFLVPPTEIAIGDWIVVRYKLQASRKTLTSIGEVAKVKNSLIFEPLLYLHLYYTHEHRGFVYHSQKLKKFPHLFLRTLFGNCSRRACTYVMIVSCSQ